MAKITKPPIRYTSRDFDSIKRDLVTFTKRYYPDTFKDFQEAGFGSMLLDTVSYVGDILSFYLDYQVNESFLNTASEFENVIRIAQQMGYKYDPSKTSTGLATFYALVPAQTSVTFESGAEPNLNYAPILAKGTRLNSRKGVPFILVSDVDFAAASNEVVVATRDTTSGRPTHYAIKAFGRVISGRLNVLTRALGDYKPFQKVVLNDNSIVEIISVTDSNGSEYFEVPNLAQDVIYRQIPNNGSDREFVKFIMQPKSSPRRFQTTRESNRMILQFGYGSEVDLDTAERNVMPSRVTMDLFGKNYVSDVTFDPNVLLKSGKFGIAPANTSLTINVRTNVDTNVNLPTNSLTTITNAITKFSDAATSAALKRQVITSLEVTNDEPITGDMSRLTADEVKILASNSYFAQNRAVTANDYKNLCYTMPSSFGGIKRAAAYKDVRSLKNNINVYVLAEDGNGKFATATSSLKNNLKTWLSRFKLLSDSIDIFDGRIINIKVDFTAIAEEGMDKAATLARAERALRKHISENPTNMGDPLFITKLINAVNEADGVADVLTLSVGQKTGSNYSNTAFDIDNNMSADGRKIFIPKNVIWEVKFPFKDINGEMR